MKSNYWLLTVIFALVALPGKAGEWIRINQLRLFAAIRQSRCIHERGRNKRRKLFID